MEKFDVDVEGRKLGEIFVNLSNFRGKSREEVIQSLLEAVATNGFYAGYDSEEDLREYLNWAVFGEEKEKKFDTGDKIADISCIDSFYPLSHKDPTNKPQTLMYSMQEGLYDFNMSKETRREIAETLKDSLKKCSRFVREKLQIYVFPTFDRFVIKNMGGCAGVSPTKNTIFMAVGENYERQMLGNTEVHELAHVISDYYLQGNYTLAEGFVFEGLAEHFREAMIGGERARWTKAISRKDAKSILKKLEDKLDSRDSELWQEVFFGGGSYPRWSGYSIGYYIVQDYLKSRKGEIDWNKLMKTPPVEIFRSS